MNRVEQPDPSFLEKVAEYRLPPEKEQWLADKVLIPVVGAAGVGKTTIIGHVSHLNDDFHRVQTVTTRPPSPRDEAGTMRHIPHNPDGFRQLTELMDAGELAQIETHKQTGYLYATELSDYPKPYNIIPMLASAMERIRRMPFQRVDAVAVSAPPNYWHEWFRGRYANPIDWADARKRLDEAAFSLDWCLKDTFVYWVKNEPGKASQAASDLIATVQTGDTVRPGGRIYAQHMLDSIASFRDEFRDDQQAAS